MSLWQAWSIQRPVPYEEARRFQLKLVDLRSQGKIQNTVLFLEHTPVITKGKGLQWTGEARPKHMPPPTPLPSSIEFCESERGGDLTYHGPGQWVVYPIALLDGKQQTPARDIAAWLRFLESSLIQTLKETYALSAHTQKNATGIWIQNQKIASLGIAVKRWVSYHGLALNVTNDLSPFFLFSPCGFPSETMTRVQDQISEWTAHLEWNGRDELEIAWCKAWSIPQVKKALTLEAVKEGLQSD